MTHIDIARAWRDPKYRRSLGVAASQLPASPAGKIELTDDDLKVASGMGGGAPQTTAPTCTAFTFLGWFACGCGPITTAINCTKWSFRKNAACGCP